MEKERISSCLENTDVNSSASELREILTQGTFPPTLWLDLDGTIKEYTSINWPSGPIKIDPDAVVGLKTLISEGVKLAVATDQSFSEMQPWLDEVAKIVLKDNKVNFRDLINGPIILERGNYTIVKNDDLELMHTIHASEQSREQVLSISQEIRRGLVPFDSVWSKFSTDIHPRFPYPDALMRIDDIARLATSVFIIKGAHVSEDPSMKEYYDMITSYLDSERERLKFTEIEIHEDSRGVALIMPRNSDKTSPLNFLEETGNFDPKRSIIACDGIQDQLFLKRCAGSIVPSNAHANIKEIATFVADKPIGKGFAQAIEAIYPETFQKFESEMSDFFRASFIQ